MHAYTQRRRGGEKGSGRSEIVSRIEGKCPQDEQVYTQLRLSKILQEMFCMHSENDKKTISKTKRKIGIAGKQEVCKISLQTVINPINNINNTVNNIY